MMSRIKRGALLAPLVLACAGAPFAPPAHAQSSTVHIGNLPLASALTGAEVAVIAQGGFTRQTPLSAIAALVTNASQLTAGTVAAALLPVATTLAPGMVSVGSGLTVAAGLLSANVTSVAGRTGAVTVTPADLPLPSADLLVGNGAGTAAPVALSGDATLTATGALTVGAIGGKAVSLGGALTTAGAYPVTLTATGSTALTLPTSGTLATTAQLSVAGSFKALAGVYLTATTATWTADELVVETALGGTPYKLANYSQTLNLAATGAGGLDTGAAPASGWLYVYAIYNPTTATASILGTTAGTGATIYPGANLPAGYTASVLIGVLRTNASSQLPFFTQRGTTCSIYPVGIVSGGTATTLTSVSISSAAPPNAAFILGYGGPLPVSGINSKVYLTGDVNMTGLICIDSSGPAGNGWAPYGPVAISPASPQTIYWYMTNPGSTILYVTGYIF